MPRHRKGPRAPVELRTISAQEAGQRIDNFLMRHFSRVPRSRVYRLLRKGEVRVNRKRVDAEYRIAAGDEVRLPPVHIDRTEEPGRPSTRLQELIERSVIFQDKHLLVIDKPAGVAVHGGSGMSFGVIEALRASRPRESLELVHRLDRDTSGCLCVARDRATLVALHALDTRRRHAQDVSGARVGRLAARHETHRCAARDGRAPPGGAARARRRGGQGIGERVQAGAVLRQARDVDAGGHPHRPHAPDPRACRLCGAPAARRRQVWRPRAQCRAQGRRAEADISTCPVDRIRLAGLRRALSCERPLACGSRGGPRCDHAEEAARRRGTQAAAPALESLRESGSRRAAIRCTGGSAASR